MSNALESQAVRSWLIGIGNHDYFPLLLEGLRIQSRMDGWAQSSEWMEMKANGFRCGFEECINAFKNLANEEYEVRSTPTNTNTDTDFDQDMLLADHVADRFN